MKQSIFTILSNTPLTDCVYKMVLSGDTSAITAPGQFVNIQITGKFLRRPISVCDYDGCTAHASSTRWWARAPEILSRMASGEKLDVLAGLGNGYDPRPARNSRRAHSAAAWVSRRCTSWQSGCSPCGKQVTVDARLQHPIGSVL